MLDKEIYMHMCQVIEQIENLPYDAAHLNHILNRNPLDIKASLYRPKLFSHLDLKYKHGLCGIINSCWNADFFHY